MNLLDFQSILDASTPDGRWNLLQDFLKKNPDWRKKVNRWLTLDPDTAAIQLQADLPERMSMPVALEPIKSEHKVRIFRLLALAKPKEIAAIESAIEAFLNEGYCCHIPIVCNDFLIMDFSRRKENKENDA